MTFPPPQQLEPLDLSRHPKPVAGSLAASDFTATGRLAKPEATRHDQLIKQTRKWVAQTFFGTLLKQMSESPFKSEMFSGGRGGQAFSSMYHQQLADRMARAAGDKLVNGIVRRIEAGAAYRKQGAQLQNKIEGANRIDRDAREGESRGVTSASSVEPSPRSGRNARRGPAHLLNVGPLTRPD